MGNIPKILSAMRDAPQNIRYDDLAAVCEHYFGKPRQEGTSHAVYKMPWQGDPRVTIQRGKGGKAKPYQVKRCWSRSAAWKEVQNERQAIHLPRHLV